MVHVPVSYTHLLIFPFFSAHAEGLFTIGNYMYHTCSMGLFAIPMFL